MRLTGISLLFLLLLEFAFRLLSPHSTPALKRAGQSFKYYPVEEATRTHPQLEYTSKKSFSGHVLHESSLKRMQIRTNSEGFRTKEFAAKAPGKFRVLILGDSTIYGEQVHQDQTIASQLEKLDPRLDVYSLGISSYSTIRQQVLANLYFEKLKPDLVILNVDQSDWEEDIKRATDYLYHAGQPTELKYAEKLASYTHHKAFVMADRSIQYVDISSWVHTLRNFSSLFEHLHWLGRSLAFKRRQSDMQRILTKTLKKASLKAKIYPDTGSLSQMQIPVQLKEDLIAESLQSAQKKYTTSFKAIQSIQTKCQELNCQLVLLSYPYPWEISTKEAVPFQLTHFGHIADLTKREVHFKLLDWVAELYKLKHWNAKPFLKKQLGRQYGQFDPHFSELGYLNMARFIFEKIKRTNLLDDRAFDSGSKD